MAKSQSNTEDEAFRSASINAWIQSKMERDKALLTLSSGGIGLLEGFAEPGILFKGKARGRLKPQHIGHM